MSLYKSYSSLGVNKEGFEHPDIKSTPVLRTESRRHKLQIIKDNPIVCVKLYAEWCQPCVKISP